MKTKLFIAVIIPLLIGCTRYDEIDSNDLSINQLKNDKRSLEEIIQIAYDAINMLGNNESRSTTRTLDLNSISCIINTQSRNVNNSADTLIYVINYTDNAGFAVISANSNTEGLLAVTEQGTYESEKAKENDGFNLFMDMAKTYVATSTQSELIIYSDSTGMEELTQVKVVRDTTVVENVLPLISTKWGQLYHEGAFAPNYTAGCANTAMAQIISYFEYPTQIDITYPGASITILTLNWTDMKQHSVKHSRQDCIASDETHVAIGQLLRQLGHLSNSSYHTDGSGTATSLGDVVLTLEGLGYIVTDWEYYNESSIRAFLLENKPIFMGASNHGWVLDGYYCHEIIRSEWWKKESDRFWMLVEEDAPYYNYYYHMNWGYDGDCNGYFISNVFQLNQAKEYDNQGYINNYSDNYNNVRYIAISR